MGPWGRGVERIFAACRAAGVPEPVLRYEPNDMWLEFAFDKAYLKVPGAGQKQTEQVTPESRPKANLRPAVSLFSNYVGPNCTG